MSHLLPTRRLPIVLAAVFGVGLGCGGSGGAGGCGSLAKLPKDPQPTGFPFDQRIEGGMQVRITKPGFDKISSFIPELAKQALATPFCLPTQTQSIGVGDLSECDAPCGGKTGCPVGIALNKVVAPPNGINISMKDDPSKAVVHLDAGFDISLPINVRGKLCIFGLCTGWKDLCTLTIASPGTRLVTDIRLDIDGPGGPTGKNTGQLYVALDNVNTLNLNLNTSGCGPIGAVINAVAGAINAIANSFIGNFIVNLLKPQLSKIIQGILPDPPGLAGVLSTGKTLAALNAPPDAALEMYMVAGGYVSSFQGGLNLGVIAGMNSDRDPMTRTPGLTSEPSLCVPSRPAPQLNSPPWNLPNNHDRNDPMLAPAAQFSGMPDPMNMMGQTQDLAIGVSRTFLDQAGFHIFNSGTMCLGISGDTLAQLNAGTLTVLVSSLSNIVEDRKAPLALAIRPEQPLHFTLGAGGMADPLLHVHVQDMRIDFYGFIEERFVRLFTLSADMEVKIDLTLTMDMNGNPAIAPMITGIDKSSIKLLVLNTDLIQEDPAKLAKTLASLFDIAIGQLMGALKPVSLPSLMGFSLDGLSITRVQTTQDDFLAIYGSLKKTTPPTMIAQPLSLPLADWIPTAREPHPVETSAQIIDVSVPPPDVIREALVRGSQEPGELPAVTLALGGGPENQSSGAPLEWSIRVDGGGWKTWSREKHQTITDAAFLLQARHQIDVKAREVDDWLSEDATPAQLEVVIDSVGPHLKPAVKQGRFFFNGWDNVSPSEALRYAWKTPAGWTELGARSSLSLDEAWAASNAGESELQVAVVDEIGNRTDVGIQLSGLNEFHGRTTNPKAAGGCGCRIGGAGERSSSGSGALALFALLPLAGLLLRRHRKSVIGFFRASRRTSVAFIALLGIAGAASVNAGCSCGQSPPLAICHVDDDCRATKCDPGLIPQCMSGMCMCNPDVALGDVGRFSALAMRGGTAYVSAYNTTYGDLMIGHVQPPGVVPSWEFVDGVPEMSASDNPLSQVRGGITDKGDDDGRYSSIQVTSAGDPVIAYYDATHGALKYASFGVVSWHNHTVDSGMGLPKAAGDDLGRFCSLTLTKDDRPGIAYYAEVAKGASGMRESQLRYAQAQRSNPSMASDWTITVVETRPMPVVPAMNPPSQILPNGIAIFTASARKPDDAPVVAYYDRERGNLRYVEFDATAGKFGKPIILDGEDASGNDTADVGQYPSVTMEGTKAHISYVDSSHDNLLYVNSGDKTPEVVDDGYRAKDETTNDGLPAPVYHLVGDSSSIQVVQGQVLIAYQDSTVEQLRFGARDPATKVWSLTTIAGHGSPFKGSYGFYAQNRISGGVAILSSYAINQHLDTPSFYVETFAVNLGTIM